MVKQLFSSKKTFFLTQCYDNSLAGLLWFIAPCCIPHPGFGHILFFCAITKFSILTWFKSLWILFHWKTYCLYQKIYFVPIYHIQNMSCTSSEHTGIASMLNFAAPQYNALIFTEQLCSLSTLLLPTWWLFSLDRISVYHPLFLYPNPLTQFVILLIQNQKEYCQFNQILLNSTKLRIVFLCVFLLNWKEYDWVYNFYFVLKQNGFLFGSKPEEKF